MSYTPDRDQDFLDKLDSMLEDTLKLIQQANAKMCWEPRFIRKKCKGIEQAIKTLPDIYEVNNGRAP
jgi:hypothetical protein